jgi:ribonuclease Z
VLVDCAEGTQRQLLVSAVGLIELREIFLTHYHADHYLGLPGMLKTFALRGRELPITIYGPPGLRDLFGSLRRIFGRLTYEYELVELAPGDVLPRDGYDLKSFAVDHGVSAVGYAFVEDERPGRFDVSVADALGVPPGPERGALQAGEAVSVPGGRVVRPEDVLGPPRPGRKLVLTGDTAPSDGVVEAAAKADLLVHEATFLEDERERARDTAHSTAADAAAIARDAGVELLALTHLSNRYSGRDAAHEARAVFPDTVVPRDFDIIELPFKERGTPQLVKGGAIHRRDGGAPVETTVHVGEERGS